MTRRDVLRAFDREVLQRKLLTVRYAGGADSSWGRSRRRGIVDLPVEFAIEDLPVPRSFLGRTLLELDLPHKYLLTALTLKPANGPSHELLPPPIDQALSDGDRLVLVGKRQDLAASPTPEAERRLLSSRSAAHGEGSPPVREVLRPLPPTLPGVYGQASTSWGRQIAHPCGRSAPELSRP